MIETLMIHLSDFLEIAICKKSHNIPDLYYPLGLYSSSQLQDRTGSLIRLEFLHTKYNLKKIMDLSTKAWLWLNDEGIKICNQKSAYINVNDPDLGLNSQNIYTASMRIELIETLPVYYKNNMGQIQKYNFL